MTQASQPARTFTWTATTFPTRQSSIATSTALRALRRPTAPPGRPEPKERKNEIIAEYRTHEGDTGSPEVQIAVLTAEINALNDHLVLIRKISTLNVVFLKKLVVVVIY